MRSTLRRLTGPAAMIAISFLVRVLYLASFVHSQPVPDGHVYVTRHETGSIATSIAQGHGYSSPLLLQPSGPTAWITPVYPYLLAGAFKIWGPFSLVAQIAVRFLNVLFSVCTTYVIFLLGKKLFGEPSGLVAGWMWALLPYAVFFPVAWLWDTSLSALVLIFAIWATYSVEEKPVSSVWAGFGVLWGFAALVNAALLSVLPGCFLFAIYRVRQKSKDWRRLGLVTVSAFAFTVSPWIVRNEIVFHGQVAFRSNFGLELWLGNNPQVPDSWTWWLHPTEDASERAKYLQMGEVPYMQEKQREAWAFIKLHPEDVARFIFHRFLETWTGNRDSFADLWSSKLLPVRANLLVNYSLPLLTCFGLLFARRKSPQLAIPLLNAVATFPLVYYVCHTTPRYRHPLDSVICVLSGFAVVSLASLARETFLGHPASSEPQEMTSVDGAF